MAVVGVQALGILCSSRWLLYCCVIVFTAAHIVNWLPVERFLGRFVQYFCCLCSLTVVPVNVKGTFAKLGVSVNGAVYVFVFLSSAVYVFFQFCGVCFFSVLRCMFFSSSASVLKVRCTFPQFCVNVKCSVYVSSVLRHC